MEGASALDTVLIIIAAVLICALLLLSVGSLINGMNPLRLIIGDTEMYGISADSQLRNTNILAALMGDESPKLYSLYGMGADKLVYRDENRREPIFMSCNTYSLSVEAYNKPASTATGTEIYGPFGIEFMLDEYEVSGVLEAAIASISADRAGAILKPYYAREYGDTGYVSCVDLTSSSVVLEKLGSDGYETVSTVSGATWAAIAESNGGVAVLREPDGSMVYGEGEYRVSLYLCQLLITSTDGNTTYSVAEPECDIYTLRVNCHECSNGILIASEDVKNYDFQLNVVNSDGAVSYSPGSKISVGDKLSLGISLSESRYELASGIFTSIGARGTVTVYAFDSEAGEYSELECIEFLRGRCGFANTAIELGGEGYSSGKYKLVLNYDSATEHIAQEYEYYFVFEG